MQRKTGVFQQLVCFLGILSALGGPNAFAQDCYEYRGNLLDGRLIFDTLAATDHLQNNHSKNCFDSLTDSDRKILGEAWDEILVVCAQNHGSCNSEALKIWNAKLAPLSDLTRERIVWAVRATEKKLEIQQAMKILNDPRIRPAFQKYSAVLMAHQDAVQKAAFNHLYRGDPKKQWTALQKALQSHTAFWDQTLYRLAQAANIDPKKLSGWNRYAQVQDLQRSLMYAEAALIRAIQEMPGTAAEKAEIQEQLRLTHSQMLDETQHFLQGSVETATAASATSSTLLIAAAFAASSMAILTASGPIAETVATVVTTHSPVGATAARILLALTEDGVTSALGTGSTQASGELNRALRAAEIESKANFSSYLCELTRDIDKNLSEVVQKIRSESQKSFESGVSLGAGFIGLSAITSKYGVVIDQLSKTLVVLGVSSFFGKIYLDRQTQLQKEREPLETELAQMDQQIRDHKTTPEALADRRHAIELKLSELNAALFRDILKGINLGIWNTKTMTKAVKTVKAHSETE